jgi:hypothetical protein
VDFRCHRRGDQTRSLFLVGKRDAAHTHQFIADVAARPKNRVQISTDGLRSYIDSIGAAFAETGVDYAQLHKTYEAEPTGPGRYSPPQGDQSREDSDLRRAFEELVSTYVEPRTSPYVRGWACVATRG